MNIYSYENQSIQQVVVGLLQSKGFKIAIAESCTSGLLTSKLTSIPGSSVVLDRSIISYSNNSKVEILSVDNSIINKHGAVSKETAKAMAKGTLKNVPIHIAITITGIAGPPGGTSTSL